MGSPDNNGAIVRRHLEEAINGRNLGLWTDLMDANFVLHHPLFGDLHSREGYSATLQMLLDAFPDLAVEILDLVATDDVVVVRYVERGTHRGQFMGHAPSGLGYEKHGFCMYRLDQARLVEAWLQEDDLGFQRQLNLL